MSTSNTFSFTDSTSSIVNDAASFLGFLDEGDVLTPAEFQLGVRELNRLTKALMVKNDRSPGMKLWQRHQGFLFLNASTGQYNLSANAENSPGWTESFLTFQTTVPAIVGNNTVVLNETNQVANGDSIGITLANGVIQWEQVQSQNLNSSIITIDANLLGNVANSATVYTYHQSAQPPQVIDWVNLRDNNGNDVFVEVLSYEQFVSLPSKQSPLFQGIPTAIYYESHLVGPNASGTLYTDVNGCSDLTRYLVINYIQELQDWVNPADQPDFPKEWNLALVRNLARYLAPHWQVQWTAHMETLSKESMVLAQSANPKRLSYSFKRRNSVAGYRNPPHR